MVDHKFREMNAEQLSETIRNWGRQYAARNQLTTFSPVDDPYPRHENDVEKLLNSCADIFNPGYTAWLKHRRPAHYHIDVSPNLVLSLIMRGYKLPGGKARFDEEVSEHYGDLVSHTKDVPTLYTLLADDDLHEIAFHKHKSRISFDNLKEALTDPYLIPRFRAVRKELVDLAHDKEVITDEQKAELHRLIDTHKTYAEKETEGLTSRGLIGTITEFVDGGNDYFGGYRLPDGKHFLLENAVQSGLVNESKVEHLKTYFNAVKQRAGLHATVYRVANPPFNALKEAHKQELFYKEPEHHADFFEKLHEEIETAITKNSKLDVHEKGKLSESVLSRLKEASVDSLNIAAQLRSFHDAKKGLALADKLVQKVEEHKVTFDYNELLKTLDLAHSALTNP